MRASTPTPDAEPAIPVYRPSQRWNIVWVVPILAVLLGGWLIYQNFKAKGPVAVIHFDTAEGIDAGKTEIRCRSVRVGVVKHVELSEDLKSVVVSAELEPDAEKLLREGSRFWVVRPRVSATDVSGLSTLITGAFIELDPGNGTEKQLEYVGLETPPATNWSIPGRRLVLETEAAGILTPGSPVYYRGFEVGRIESRRLAPDGGKVIYDAFIKDEYSHLVKTNSRFWNSSGIDITAGVDGFKVRTPSFQAMVSGGVVFGLPENEEPGEAAKNGTVYTLYRDEAAAQKASFNPTLRFLLQFNQSVRGLSRGAPVEFRGIVIGRVVDISFNYYSENESDDRRIPVLIEIDPYQLRRETAEKLTESTEFIAEAVANGFRAALKTGSLLTGAMYVDLDFYPNAEPAQLGIAGNLPTLPTISSGFSQLEAKITAILDKLQALPLDETMRNFSLAAETSQATLKEIQQTAEAARKTLDDPQFRQLPSDLRKTLDELQKSVNSVGPDGAIQGDLLRSLDELRAALRSIKSMTNSINEKPSSLLWGKDSSGNPVPKAPKN
ncbi:MAG: intermembrane transport protein PqiB [Luteolibacter sp.]